MENSIFTFPTEDCQEEISIFNVMLGIRSWESAVGNVKILFSIPAWLNPQCEVLAVLKFGGNHKL